MTYYHFVYYPESESMVTRGVTIEGLDLIDCARIFEATYKVAPYMVYLHLTYEPKKTIDTVSNN